MCAQILLQFQSAEEKNRLLRAVAGAGVDSLSSLRAKWDKLELIMESHQLMIKEQVTPAQIVPPTLFPVSFFIFRVAQSHSYFAVFSGGGHAGSCGRTDQRLQGRSGAF